LHKKATRTMMAMMVFWQVELDFNSLHCTAFCSLFTSFSMLCDCLECFS
jgi:hypothetical protein